MWGPTPDLFRRKGGDTCTPIGSFIPRSEIPNPNEVVIQLTVNGEERFNTPVGHMIYSIAQ
jgi:2-keto-4-pentenoate hydratase/2-oxohepta-3-ene-1,7-dioic acid hydratase in catechol pathway